ncbi:MAG: hypothetical protein ACR2QM_08080 [Longimicrobiales bacterium]
MALRCALVLLMLVGACDREAAQQSELELQMQAELESQMEALNDAQMELEGTQGMTGALEDAGNLPSPTDGAPRPAEAEEGFVPGDVYGLHPQMCHNHGGSPGTDPEGEPVCNLGTASAVFRCDGGHMVALIDRPRGRKILHRDTGSYEVMEPEAREHGTRYVGEHNVFMDFGDEGRLTTAEWGVTCRPVDG